MIGIEEAVETLGHTLPLRVIPCVTGTPQARQIYQISKIVGTEAFTLNFLFVTPIYQDVWENRELFEWQGLTLQAVSCTGLLKMKRLAGRKQDLLDIEKPEQKTE